MKISSDEVMGAGVVLAWILFLGLSLIGWVLNIVALFQGADTMSVGELIVRFAGIFVAPIGVIMGWFF